jgi:hypothetical protein
LSRVSAGSTGCHFTHIASSICWRTSTFGILGCFTVRASKHHRENSALFKHRSNPALNLAPFGRWTLRDKAAQRR